MASRRILSSGLILSHCRKNSTFLVWLNTSSAEILTKPVSCPHKNFRFSFSTISSYWYVDGLCLSDSSHHSIVTPFPSLFGTGLPMIISFLSHLDKRAIRSLALLNPHAFCKSPVLRPSVARQSIFHSLPAKGDSSVMSDTNVELPGKVTLSSSSTSCPSSIAPQHGHGFRQHSSQTTQRGMQRQRSHFQRANRGNGLSGLLMHREQ